MRGLVVLVTVASLAACGNKSGPFGAEESGGAAGAGGSVATSGGSGGWVSGGAAGADAGVGCGDGTPEGQVSCG